VYFFVRGEFPQEAGKGAAGQAGSAGLLGLRPRLENTWHGLCIRGRQRASHWGLNS